MLLVIKVERVLRLSIKQTVCLNSVCSKTV